MSIVFGMLGSILVGLGIILILAHNWDNLTRPVKIFFSFLPVVIGQAICGYALFKKSGNRTWKEASAAFLFFAVGASIALVAQVYNISGDLPGFLFTWMLLCCPLIYLMPSSIVSLLFIAGISMYAVNVSFDGIENSYHYWWMILIVMPYYFTIIKNNPKGNFTSFHHWLVPLSLTICLATVGNQSEEYLLIAYINLFAVFYLLNMNSIIPAEKLRSNSYLIIGSLGTMGILMALSFNWFWKDMIISRPEAGMPELAAVTLSFLPAAYLLYRHVRQNKVKSLSFFGFIFILFSFIFLVGMGEAKTATILMNLLVLAAAIVIMRQGLTTNHLGILNYGLLMTAILAVCRFFDTDISFVLRGMMFVAVGAGFFIANTTLLKKRKQHV